MWHSKIGCTLFLFIFRDIAINISSRDFVDLEFLKLATSPFLMTSFVYLSQQVHPIKLLSDRLGDILSILANPHQQQQLQRQQNPGTHITKPM